jgi:hypothetical protein
MRIMRLKIFCLTLAALAFVVIVTPARSQGLTSIELNKFHPVPAPNTTGLFLKPGDRLAVCGDSITEQKMYSRMIEDYLTMCAPELKVSIRQYGWGGEIAVHFLSRMTNDCLRFQPTIATTCYGMNDFKYRPYEDGIGQAYRESSTAVVEAFKANGTRVILGSSGCVAKVPPWVKNSSYTLEDLDLSLCELRNIDIEIAKREKVRFADVYWPMLMAGIGAQEKYGTNYEIAGSDGVHPHWAGHTVMAYTLLKAMGLNGDIGTFTANLNTGKLKASKGHEVISARDGVFVVKSSRYPFCCCLEAGQAAAGYPICGNYNATNDNTIQSGMTLVPFNQELNRLMLVASHGTAARYQVTWGNESKIFAADQLAEGINLAVEFPCNPFCETFSRVDAAVAAKEVYETKQIKELFYSSEARTNMEDVVARSETEHTILDAAIKAAFVPVTHTLKITAQ